MASKTPFELEAGEQLVFKGNANKTGFWGGPGGKLILTDRRLIFANRRGSTIRMDLPLSELIYVGKARTWTIWLVILPIPNAIKVTTRAGKSQKFTVVDRAQWVALISKRINA